MHDNDSTIVNIYIPLTSFIKGLYPTYYHYLKSLQASGQLKSITFDNLAEKVVECDKSFGKKYFGPLVRLCALLRKGIINHMILLKEKEEKQDV
jgi:hypothetical protein